MTDQPGDPGGKAEKELHFLYGSADLERYHDYSYGDLVDAFWAGYRAAVKESRPE